MRLLRRLALRLRRGRPVNQRYERSYAHREILGSLALGAPRPVDALRLWRVAVWAGLALISFQIQAGFLTRLGPELVRLDVAVLFVTFFALRLGAIEGSVAAFAVGYVADLFVQGPPGLCRFMAVAVWTTGRMAWPRSGRFSWIGVVIYTTGASFVYQAGILGGLLAVAPPGAGPGSVAWLSLVPQAAIAGLLALPVHGLLGRLDQATQHGKA
ncbi:hypothetical protein [Vulgatibacter incomptus]|uniref:Rod shape-determining protein MreD n=1 Tax=Vulgatibacter incomptus TaxID=1391653 RepID=A0A0K1PCH0_9BACT|nr:hypothetical protein [Vulgatibacter incomptus]AKU91205.1 hypothetical protein AKJ08_1592 [Vulgatibacter incomptus]